MLKQIETAIRNLALPSHPAGLYEPIEYVLSMGGKRLRPMLLLLSYSLFRPDYERAMNAAVGIEVYHNHTLLHDDLMDNSDMRRGVATVHKKWNANTAILSGDTMLLLALRLITSVSSPHNDLASQLLIDSAIAICEGQQHDINFETLDNVSEEDYLEMIRLKTSVLLGCATKMGGLLAGASTADCNTLYSFGETLGLAFQLQDDYLDAYGHPAIFGKRIGGDILSGKKTILAHAALNRMPSKERPHFLALLNCHDLIPDEKIARIMDYYEHYQVAQTTQAHISRLFEEAHAVLRGLSADATPLWEYAQTLMSRQK